MEREIKKITIISIVVVGILVISLVAFLIARSSNKNKQEEFAKQMSGFEEFSDISESASTPIGKSVNEVEDEEVELSELEDNDIDEDQENTETASSIENTSNEENKSTSTNSKKIEEKNKTEQIDAETKIEESDKTEQTNAEVKKEENEKKEQTNSETKKEAKMDFEAPIKGEIIREFAKDSLVFSNTLQEWITHNGVDIKADKTSVVKAAANGTVYAIKNDPRYGLTVIINHDNGYQTIYSNLLTAEFVVKGEKVEKGQSIGTVGNTASFEVSDDYHLHFELLRNNEYLDPVIYINF